MVKHWIALFLCLAGLHDRTVTALSDCPNRLCLEEGPTGCAVQAVFERRGEEGDECGQKYPDGGCIYRRVNSEDGQERKYCYKFVEDGSQKCSVTDEKGSDRESEDKRGPRYRIEDTEQRWQKNWWTK